MAHPSGPDDCDGKWHNHFFCSLCDHRMTYHQKMYSHGCCLFCGHGVMGTVVDTVTRPMRWEPVERKWWQIWRVCEGRYVEKGKLLGPVKHKDLTEVTVFKGPSGIYSVSQEKSVPLGEHHPFWVVDKIVDDMAIAYEDGESSHQTIHPRSGRDRNVGGSFREEQVARDSARAWAGVPEPVLHPAPNRRGAIAHTKAKS